MFHYLLKYIYSGYWYNVDILLPDVSMKIFEQQSVLPDIPINLSEKSTHVFLENSMEIDDHDKPNLTGLSHGFKIRNVQFVLSTSKPVYSVPDPKMSTAK